jgi:hypothetical protein
LKSFPAGDNAHKKGVHSVLFFISFYFVTVTTLTKAFMQTLKVFTGAAGWKCVVFGLRLQQ